MIEDLMTHGASAGSPGQPRIEECTPIVPRAIAEAVCEEAGVWIQTPLPRGWVRELTAHASTVYAHNQRFARRIRAGGDRGRDYLWMFMRHWLAALLKDRHPQQFSRLPASYSAGADLPDRRPGHAR
jgi:hypothetical protein